MRSHDPLPPSRPVVLLSAIALLSLSLAFIPRDENDYDYRVNKGLEVFGQIFRETSQSYVDPIDPDAFMNTGIEAMLKTLDPYTVMQRTDASDVDLLTTGSYGGIGITVGFRDSMVTITDVVDGYSAQQKGVRIGDRLMEIDGHNVLHGPVDALRIYTRGEPGSPLTVRLLRDGTKAPLVVTLTRDNIRIRSVAFSRMMPDGIGYIRLERFSATAGNEVHSALVDLKRQADLNGVILDLRDNPGGLLDAAVDVAGEFLPKGSLVVSTRGRDSGENRAYRTTSEPTALRVPLIVLVNENTASAAEIVAGAIQDLDAGVIMGRQSFGKGLVQTVRRLSYETSLKLTTARYYTPSGRCIQKVDYTARRNGDHAGVDQGPALRPGVFHTAAGRMVEQHGGIRPDTLVAADERGGIVEQLRSASYFFKFATRYTAPLPTLPPDFTVGDDLVAQFTAFALDSAAMNPSDSSTVALLAAVEQTARTEGQNTEMLHRIAELRGTLQSERRRLLAAHREEVRRELYREISARFRGQLERKMAAFADDRQIRTAVDLLHTGRTAYERLLNIRG